MRRSILLPACLALAAVSGCGNKGPLYMPPASPAAAKPAPKPAPTSAPAHASTASQPANSSSVVTKPLSGS